MCSGACTERGEEGERCVQVHVEKEVKGGRDVFRCMYRKR